MTIEKTAQWTLVPNKGWDGLQLHSDIPIPPIGEGCYLVQIQAVSLNYRDVALPMGQYPMASKTDIVPCSDAAGVVIAAGPATSRFQVGDRVCTAFNPAHQSGFMTPEKRKHSLGSVVDGILRKHGVFPETALVLAPNSLDIIQASTLSCAAVTAWNCLFGLSCLAVNPGDWVLTQGTGGVSLFAVQFALAAGANVVVTTSSAKKMDMLNKMGVKQVINHTEDLNWGESAKKLTPAGEGFHHVIEVGGETTIAQSLKAVRMEGVISLVGFLGGNDTERKCSFGDCLTTLAIVRGICVGPTEQFVACNNFIDKHHIKPIVDERIFEFSEAPEALKYLWDKKQIGKVVIRID